MKTFRVDGKTFTTAEETASYIIENMSEEIYDDALDECYEMVKIGGLEYYPSRVLKAVDPIAYQCGMADYFDGFYPDFVYELENETQKSIDLFEIGGFEVEIMDEDE